MEGVMKTKNSILYTLFLLEILVTPLSFAVKPKNSSILTPAQVSENLYLGKLYYGGGQGFDKDFTKAKEFIEPVAQQTADPAAQADAQLHLGLIYYWGHRTAQDYTKENNHSDQDQQDNVIKAYSYFKSAAEQTVHKTVQEEALSALGMMHLLGNGTTQDDNQAFAYFKQAEALATTPKIKNGASFFLGKMYYLGLGVSQDYLKAFTYFIVASNSTNPTLKTDSLNFLENMYQSGEEFSSPTATECIICMNTTETPKPNPLVMLPCPNNHQNDAICLSCLRRIINKKSSDKKQKSRECPLCRSTMLQITIPE